MTLNKKWLRYAIVTTLIFWLLTPWISFSLSERAMMLSGWSCLVVMLGFWILPSIRFLRRAPSNKHLLTHEWLGIILLLPLSIHGSQYRNIQLFCLGILLLGILWFGQKDFSETTKQPSKTAQGVLQAKTRWWWAHILLAFLIMGLISVHVWSVLAYS